MSEFFDRVWHGLSQCYNSDMGIVPGSWKIRNSSIDCTRPVLMGIINVTPDSFSDGGQFFRIENAIAQAGKHVSEGADILDIGGESTRPGSDPVSIEGELERVVPVIQGIRDAGINLPISVDTRRLEVAEKAVQAGAEIINDVAALRDSPGMGQFAAENGLGVVLMHMKGTPKEMQVDPQYDDVIREIGEFFQERIDFALECGIDKECIVLDPGIGFGKLLNHNLTIHRKLGIWLDLGHPILFGPSRKRFIGEILDKPVEERLYGTIGSCVAAMYSGARIFRVHDVGPVRDALNVAWAIKENTMDAS